MTLDEAIERYTSNAEYERTHGNLQGCMDFKQLAEWLKDYNWLKNYKRLLGAIQDLKDIKAEILCLLKSEELCDEYDIGCNDGLKLALSRIDKHISGKE